ncbi:hypothetical protein E0500_036880 [Streptomyces sp. KM273126]|nr:hypothetical protein [Streptomyces sp. KM273126]MBA2812746.1 hypothetical protein [Streptomyces sp. KM273126]
MLKEVTATRYITPLREGGSLPGLVEAATSAPMYSARSAVVTGSGTT